MTPRQAEVLDAVRTAIAAAGYPPTLRELARLTGLSMTRVRQHLAALVAAGAIHREEGTARGIRVLTAQAAAAEPPAAEPPKIAV